MKFEHAGWLLLSWGVLFLMGAMFAVDSRGKQIAAGRVIYVEDQAFQCASTTPAPHTGR